LTSWEGPLPLASCLVTVIIIFRLQGSFLKGCCDYAPRCPAGVLLDAMSAQKISFTRSTKHTGTGLIRCDCTPQTLDYTEAPSKEETLTPHRRCTKH
jgi:hypothetical protein